MTCSASCPSGRGCSRKAKYEFVGEDRRETRCGIHAYEWLGLPKMPSWITQVTIRGVPVPVR